MTTLEKKTEKISYADLARRVGDCILNNEIHSQLDYEWEIVNGDDSYCYKHDDSEACKKADHECDYESIDIYQEYIISKEGAEYLQRHTDEIVYHCKDLDIYLWGITHFGTSWSIVFTEINTD